MTKRVLAVLVAAALLLIMAMPMVSAEEEKPTMKVLCTPEAFDMNEDIVAKMLEEYTGWHVEYSNWTDSQSLMLTMASDNEYDLVKTTPNEYLTLKTQHAVKELTPFLTDELKGYVQDTAWPYVTDADGKIWGYPVVGLAVYSGGTGYREDIFAEYGFTEPNTVDELYQLMVDIKEKTGLIPLTGNEAVQPVIASGFGLGYEFVVDPETDEIKSWLRNPGMKEYLTFMNKCYTEGLIDIDWPVNDGDMINNKMSTTAAVMTTAYHWSPLTWVTALVENGDEDAYFDQIIPLEDAAGKRHIGVTNSIQYVWVVPANASDERTELAMQLIDNRNQPDVYWMFNDGYEGTHYTKDENGYPIPILPIFNDDMAHGDKYQIGCNQYVHPISWMARVHKSQVQWDAFYDANSKAAVYGFEGDPLAFSSFPEYGEYKTALTAKCNDYFMQVIAGTESIEGFEDFVAEWEEEGGLELEEAATAWYHENPELVAAASSSNCPYNEIFGLVGSN